ncbi:MAG: TrpB-like pyridoxal phosphate-dependent enzyme [Candidatus Lokiarchaeota archaeon]|nr:TrpB-like pyridoxal phosphate-dependent enzyme [Candidatus Lokiarchaeota archaeon]
MVEKNRVILTLDEMPRKWYNIAVDSPEPFPPYLNPANKEPMPPEPLMELFPKECVKQEASQERYIDIPDELLDIYMNYLGRPSPLCRAVRLEKYLNTPAEIYYKREDLSPPGSHKPNTAVAQAFYAKREGLETLTTETGAGQWGSALAYSCALFDLECKVFMVRISYEQKPLRKTIMKIYGADCVPSPSDTTESGKKFLEDEKNYNGSLGMAISEAIEMAMKDENAKYTLGSVLNYVLLHQTIVGEEVIKQFEKLDKTPDIMIGCVGGGSNFSGFVFPYLGKSIRKECKKIDIHAIEPTACPSMSGGEYRYDFGDTAQTTPLIKMYTLGCDFVPPPIHAGGLRYHGAAPSTSSLAHQGLIDTFTYPQEDIFASAKLFAKVEGLIPAPETSHATHHAIMEAKKCKKTGEKKIIVFNHSGHGLMDLGGYRQILNLE